jgi:hypothetical protein
MMVDSSGGGDTTLIGKNNGTDKFNFYQCYFQVFTPGQDNLYASSCYCGSSHVTNVKGKVLKAPLLPAMAC